MGEDIAPILIPIGTGLLGVLVGALVGHYLTKSRESEKDDRAAMKERKALEVAMRLSDSEREILRQCVASNGFERGRVWILRVGAFGSWIRAGKHDFMDQHDSSVQARYMDAFESLFGRGYFRSEGRTLFHLTGAGFERAQNDT